MKKCMAFMLLLVFVFSVAWASEVRVRSEEEQIAIYDRLKQSVARIEITVSAYDLNYNKVQEAQCIGSGTVVPGGMVLTCNHVVDLQEIKAFVKARTVYESGVKDFYFWTIIRIDFPNGNYVLYHISDIEIFANEKYDYAFISIFNLSDYVPPLAFGDSDKIVGGQDCFAMGCPEGVPFIFTMGVMSDGREKMFGFDHLKMDMSLSPGQSGSAIVNSNMEIIGIIDCVRLSYGHAVAFAIPVNNIKNSRAKKVEY